MSEWRQAVRVKWAEEQRKDIDEVARKAEAVASRTSRDVKAELRSVTRKLKNIEKKVALITSESYDVTNAQRDAAFKKVGDGWAKVQAAYEALLHAAGQLSLFS